MPGNFPDFVNNINNYKSITYDSNLNPFFIKRFFYFTEYYKKTAFVSVYRVTKSRSLLSKIKNESRYFIDSQRFEVLV